MYYIINMGKRNRKDKEVPLTEYRSHGVYIQEYLWRMVSEGMARSLLTTRRAYMEKLILDDAKRKGYYRKYIELVKNKVKKELESQHE